jgi:predicted ATP-binding protein involved in virulence
LSDKFFQEVEHQSKIVSLKIENFMSIKEAFIEFDDSNVISLCGYNDSGKSAITRLLEVMFYNAYATDQVKFITDGEEHWTGILTFSDGVVYTRRKYADGKSLWELTKGDTVLFSNKLANGTYAAMGDTPDVIERYLGVIQDELTGEELNVRRNTDRLFLINTSGGDNYKILNSVLRSDVLSSASKALNEDKNKLNAEVTEKTTVKGVIKEQYESYDVAPQEEMNDVKQYISNLEENKGRIVRLSALMEENQRKHSISLYDVLEPIDTSRLSDLKNILNLSTQKNAPVYSPLSKIELARLQELKTIISYAEKLHVATYDELTPVDIQRLEVLKGVADNFNTLSNIQKSYDRVSAELEATKSKLLALSQQYNLKVCHNCGSVVS